jgi:hypothetical protein
MGFADYMENGCPMCSMKKANDKLEERLALKKKKQSGKKGATQ